MSLFSLCHPPPPALACTGVRYRIEEWLHSISKHLSDCRHHNERDGVATLSPDRGSKTGLLSFLFPVTCKGKCTQIFMKLETDAISCNKSEMKLSEKFGGKK